MASQDVSINVQGPETNAPADENCNSVMGNTDHSENGSGKTVPLLRVEELKDTSTYTSGDEDQTHDVSDDADRNLPEFVPPTEELKEKIINQVEFYFSDASILKDAFLLKHVRRNKQGYVSIKLITSFKKMKSLTKDYRVVAFSLRQSDQLEVNDEGKKVRRKNPLPEYDETTPSRSVLVVNLPMENPTIETIAEMFSKCGDVALIRILRPNKPVPQDIKKYTTKHPEIGNSVCAIVEFEKHEHAKLAVDSMNNTQDWRNGLRVVLVAEPKKKDKNNELKNGDKKEGKNHGENDEKRKKKKSAKKQANNDAVCYSSGSDYDPPSRSKSYGSSLSPSNVDNSKLSPGNSPRSSPRSSPMTSPRAQRRRLGPHGKSPLADHSPGVSPRGSPRSSPESSRKKYDYSSGGDSTPSSPWVQRRIKAAQEMSVSPLAGSPAGSPMLGRKKLLDMSGVMRQPKGPDGTAGFHFGRGKPRASTIC